MEQDGALLLAFCDAERRRLVGLALQAADTSDSDNAPSNEPPKKPSEMTSATLVHFFGTPVGKSYAVDKVTGKQVERIHGNIDLPTNCAERRVGYALALQC